MRAWFSCTQPEGRRGEGASEQCKGHTGKEGTGYVWVRAAERERGDEGLVLLHSHTHRGGGERAHLRNVGPRRGRGETEHSLSHVFQSV